MMTIQITRRDAILITKALESKIDTLQNLGTSNFPGVAEVTQSLIDNHINLISYIQEELALNSETYTGPELDS